jgi:hypothetical protein
VLNVGWLDGAHGYPQGATPPAFEEKLWAYCRVPVSRLRGLHTCEVCADPTDGFQATRGEEKLLRGSAEIRVFGSRISGPRGASPDGPPVRLVYAAPDMVYHYVIDHHYRPPDEFIQAVLQSSPAPGSPEYESLVGHYAS